LLPQDVEGFESLEIVNLFLQTLVRSQSFDRWRRRRPDDTANR
jgi:hypothetical protein